MTVKRICSVAWHVVIGAGEKVADCSEASIIGRNTGVYVGGLPDDYIIQRVDTEERAQVLKLYKQDALISI